MNVSLAKKSNHLLIDAVIIAISIILAVSISKLGLAERMIELFGDNMSLTIFVSGLFFTSFFTTAPAIVLLGQLAEMAPLWMLVIVGGFGAVVGDCILFWFIRDRIADDIKYLTASSGMSRFRRAFHTKLLRRLTPFLGLLIIASPLPDELGIALLGLNGMKIGRFLVASFIANAIGILIIGLIADALLQ